MALYVASGLDYLCGRCSAIIPAGISLIGDEAVGVLGYDAEKNIIHTCGDTTGLEVPS